MGYVVRFEEQAMPQNKLRAVSFSRHVLEEERAVNTVTLDLFIIEIWLSEFLRNLAQVSTHTSSMHPSCRELLL